MAEQPTYSNNNTTVTVNLKNYKWSNGETVTAQDVLFFMNMLHAQKANWAATSPAAPTSPTTQDVTIDSPTQLDLHLTTPSTTTGSPTTSSPRSRRCRSPGTRRPPAGAAGSGGCSAAAYGTADAACTKVYTFLSNQPGYNPSNPKAANNSLPTYATNPLWQVVDGPWKLNSFNADGQRHHGPNPSYSGPVKPTLKTFTELPFTSDTAEFNALVGAR